MKKVEVVAGVITQEEALIRELEEELGISPKIDKHFLTVVHQYPHFELTMHSYLCKAESQDLVLHEHIKEEWLFTSELNKLDWAAADIPIVNKLRANE